MLFSLFTHLSAAFCGKLSTWKAAGEGSAEPFSAVPRRLSSGQRERPGLARAEVTDAALNTPLCGGAGSSCRRTKDATATCCPQPSPARAGSATEGQDPPGPARRPLPRDGASIPQLRHFQPCWQLLSLIYSFAGDMSWRVDERPAVTRHGVLMGMLAAT